MTLNKILINGLAPTQSQDLGLGRDQDLDLDLAPALELDLRSSRAHLSLIQSFRRRRLSSSKRVKYNKSD